jgi:hypothetical protein
MLGRKTFRADLDETQVLRARLPVADGMHRLSEGCRTHVVERPLLY